MPGGIDISLLGLKGKKSLAKKFARVKFQMQKKILMQALRAGAKPVQASAKSNAPHGVTGNLARTIKIRVLKSKRKGLHGIGVMTGTREKLEIPSDDPYYYPMAVETGHGSVPAQPFMRPALDANRERALAIIAREIEAGIKKAVR